MEDYRLEQSGQEVQDILNGAAMQVDLTAENDRAELAERTLQGNIDDEASTRENADIELQGHIDDEEIRAKAAEKQNADDIDAIEEKIPSGASSQNKLATAGELAAKQDALTFDNAPTPSSTNPVTSGGVYTAIDNEKGARINADAALQQSIEAILLLIPSAATALNQLADKSFVNSTVATASATFRGTYNLVSDLSLAVTATHAQIAAALAGAVSGADNNDYCFVQIPTSADTPTEIRVTERYKFNGETWAYEYDLNNSGFTAAQWEAINSAITSALVTKLSALPTASELTTLFAGKQNTLTFDNAPVSGSSNPVKSGGIYDAIAAITAVIPSAATSSNKLVDLNALTAYVTGIIGALDASFDLTSTDGHVTLKMTQVDGVITTLQILTSDIASAQALTTLGGQVSTNADDIAALQALYNALQQSAPQVIEPTDTWPVASPSDTVIYRVVDRVNTPPQYYSDYMWNGTAMVLMATYNNAIDPRPKKASQNLVTSGGVFDNMGALDVSELNATENPHALAQYVDLSAALAAVPIDYQKGGMSIKFVQSYDNKYVQYRLRLSTFTAAQFANAANWQGVDDVPTDGSDNLVKSGGVAKVLNDTINPEKINLTVQSGGYYTVSSGQIVLQETEGNYYATYSVSEDGVYVVSGVNYRAREIIIENPDHTFEILPSTEVNTVPKHILVTLYAGQTLYISSLGDYISLYHIGSFNDYDVIIKKYIKNFTENVACIYKLRMQVANFESDYYYTIANNIATKHESRSYKTCKLEVVKGDIAYLTSNALPSSGLRTYTLTDKDYNIISESPVSTTYNNEAIPVTVNGYLFLNASVIDEVFSCIIERNMFNIDYDFETAIKKAFLNTIPSSEIGTDGTYFGTAGKVWIEDSRFTRYKAMNLQKGDVVSYDISMTNTTAPYFFKVDDDNNITDVILTLNGTSSASGEYTVLESGLYVFAIRSGSFSVLYCKYKQTEIFKQGEAESLKLITDGGYLGIFQRIGVIGDSLASGALSYGSPNTQGVDMYFYSWPQYIQRKLGNTIFNFSRGGLSTRSFFTTDNEYVRRFDTENCQCYFIALGHNDWNWCNANWESEGYSSLDECITAYIGSESDIDLNDYSNNADTYYGNYGKIIQMIKEKVPNAKIFPVVMKVNSKFGAFNAAVKRMAHLFDNIFIIDAAKWFPQIPDGHYTEGHGNAIGYSTYANEVATMANAIIDENRQYFKYTGLIGTEYASYIPASDNGSVPSD